MAAAEGTTTVDVWPSASGPPPIGDALRDGKPVDTSVNAPARDGKPVDTTSGDAWASEGRVDEKQTSPVGDGKLADVPDGDDASTAHFRSWLARDPYLLLHKAVYFAGMGANGAWYPYALLYWRLKGINAMEAGTILAASHLASLLCAPVLSRYADTGEANRRRVLVGGAMGAALLIICAGWASSFWQFLVLQTLAEASYASVWPIVDASTMAQLKACEGNTAAYGNSRAFGAAGWGICALISGMLYDRYSLSAIFTTYAAMILPFFFLTSWLPLEKRGATAATVESAWRKLLTVDVGVFMLVVTISAALLLVVDTFRVPYLAGMGASNTLLGLSVTVTAMSEAPCFFVTAYVLRHVSMPLVLLLVLVAYVGRFAWYATMTDPWMTMPMELLHGVQFAFGWAASVSYVSSLLPPELSSSAQGLLSAFQWGIGSAFGAFMGGYIWNATGGRSLMWACSGLGLVGVAVMALSMWRTRRIARAAG
jgi:PPP family 3-phenylpropionic acid transporter